MSVSTTIENIQQDINIKGMLKSSNLLLPKFEYEAMRERLEDLEDIQDSAVAMKEYQEGKCMSFLEYDKQRRARRYVQS